MIKKLIALLMTVTVCLGFTSCNLFTVARVEIDETLFRFEEQLSPPKAGEEIAVVTTSLGSFSIKLFPDYAPNAVENFTTLAKQGHYDQSYIFCVDNDKAFMGGSKDNQGIEYKSIFNEGKPFDNEYSDAIWHFSGSVSAISNEAEKSDSRFLVLGEMPLTDETLQSMERYGYPQTLLDKYKSVGGSPNLDRRHTVFGQVFEGLDVVAKINKVKVDAETGRPVEDVVIEKIEIKTYGE